MPNSAHCAQCDAPSTTTCVCCQKPLCDEHKIMGHPLITFRQLVTAIWTTALRAPSLLGDILFKELDQVPYCATCREDVAARRQTEQLKFAGAILLVLVLIIGIPAFLIMT